MFARRNVPLQMLATGVLLANLLGIHRQSLAQAIISRIRPSCRVERAIRVLKGGLRGCAAKVAWHNFCPARRPEGHRFTEEAND